MAHAISKATVSTLKLAITASLLVTLMVGCSKSDPTGTVKGKVLLGDTPYSGGSIVLLSPTSGRGGSAELQADGTFSITEPPLPVGTYSAYIAPKENANMEAAMKSGMDSGVKMDEQIPQKYWNESLTDLSVTIEEGENEVTLTMTKD